MKTNVIFGISKKIQMIMAEQQKRKKTRKQSLKEEEWEELLVREYRMNRRHETTTPISMCPAVATSVP